MPKTRKTRILLADDHPIVRDGLRLLISAQPDLEVVGEAENGRQVLALAKTLCPDIVVMDLSMPQLSGLEATTLLKRSAPDLKVLVLTVHDDESYLQQLVEAGASGYVLKRSAGNELVGALRTVAAGGVFFDRILAERNLVNQLGGFRAVGRGRVGRPSPREEKVLRLVAWGYTHKEIAGQLGVSMKSVETYRTRLCQKLGLRSRTEIVRYALRQGWLKEE